jgi:hypothetical protein
VTTHGPSPVESSLIQPPRDFYLYHGSTEETSVTREGEAHKDNVINHLSTANAFIIMGPGTKGRRVKKKHALRNQVRKETLSFLFRNMWRHRMGIDLVLNPFRRTRGRLKKCFSVALLERGAACAFPELNFCGSGPSHRYQARSMMRA